MLKVLTFGWEFPPNNYGGLGIACEGLIRGLINNNIHVFLVLPRQQTSSIQNCEILSTDQGTSLNIKAINSSLQPYITSSNYQKWIKEHGSSLYGEYIFAEIERYAYVARQIIQSTPFDIIHAHDWMSIKAGVAAKQISNKPLVLHIHATEFDRTGGNSINPTVYGIEKWGMECADAVVTVSEFTKQKIVHHYGIDHQKITVVHNAISQNKPIDETVPPQKHNPLVLFLGRLTLQKGPDYFVTAAQKVLEYRPDVTFAIAGSGDMQQRLIDWVASIGLSDKILFTGLLRGDQVDMMYKKADLFVMPSVSEPFGLTALEAMKQGTPVIISKQSGVSEVILHCLKVDFWDIHQMVSKIISVIDYNELHKELAHNGKQEIQKFNWNIPAQKCIDLYNRLCCYA